MPDKHPLTLEVETLFRHLRDTREFRWRRRISAAWDLLEFPLTAEQRSEFRDTLRHFLLKPEGAGKQMLTVGGRFLALVVLLSLIWTSFHHSTDYLLYFAILTFISLPTIFPLLLIFRANLDRRVRIAFILTLERLRDPMSTDALAFAASDPSSDVNNVADRALLTVLPTLLPEYYGQLSAHTVPYLCRILEGRWPRDYDPPVSLISALFVALEKIGDGRAIPTLQRLIKFGPKNQQNEAQRLLNLLKERHELETQRGILLRAASAPATTSDELLHPAVEATTTEPAQLLRASIAGSAQRLREGREVGE